MKKKNYLLLIILGFIIAFSSCKKDNVSNVNTQTNFSGTWLCTESSKLHKNSTFTVEIKTDSSSGSRIFMYNFYNIGSSYSTYGITDMNTVSIPSQKIFSNTLSIHGNGTLTNNKITWIYYVNDGADLDTATAVFTKQ